MITATGLAKSYGARTLFEGASFELSPQARYGLVGANGSGKTTLLRLFSGDELASDGQFIMPRQLSIGVLRQDRYIDDDKQVIELAMMADPAWPLLEEQHRLAEESSPDPSRVAELEEQIRGEGGYTLRSRASSVLAGLGIPTSSHERALSTLSGGFKLRVQLAQVLVARTDLLLLDEPTNHLDILSIRWLEKFLGSYEGCAVIISHDRRFLDQVTTHILDVDYGTVTAYTGNYTAFEQQKKSVRLQKEAEIARQEKIVADKLAFIERFRYKATKARQAQSRLKQVEKIDIEELPKSSRRHPYLKFEPLRPSGRDVLTVDKLGKSYGENRVLTDVSLTVRRGERVAVIGPNGIGKSTLLKVLVSHLTADQGAFTWGHETRVGYFAQDHRDLLNEPQRGLLSWLWGLCPTEPESQVRGRLGQVLFSGDDANKTIGALSGGEAARLVFGKLIAERPNVLVLDEPTNHLDIEAIEALVRSLKEFDGTVVFVSHDRWFVSELATRVLELTPEGRRDFPGSYDEYLAQCGDDHLDGDLALMRAREAKSQEQTERLEERERVQSAREDLKKKRNRFKALPARRDAALASVSTLEEQLAAVEAAYAVPGFFERTTQPELMQCKQREDELRTGIHSALADWEALEGELSQLEAELAAEA